MKRKIIRIDEKKCTGCGLCIPNCPEGAIRIVDGVARVVSDLYCDGLGACIGHCPEGAIEIEEREAEAYDEAKVMVNVVRGGEGVIRAHLEHLREHGQAGYLAEALAFLEARGIAIPPGWEARPAPAACGAGAGGCPGARVADFGRGAVGAGAAGRAARSRLGQWPVQLHLVPPSAPFLKGADLLVAADCVPFAYADFHDGLLAGKALLVGCPKLDDTGPYAEKLAEIFRRNDIRSVTVAHMEVPCCGGIVRLVRDALAASGREIPFHDVEIGIRGERV